jgi:hypothetical protein
MSFLFASQRGADVYLSSVTVRGFRAGAQRELTCTFPARLGEHLSAELHAVHDPGAADGLTRRRQAQSRAAAEIQDAITRSKLQTLDRLVPQPIRRSSDEPVDKPRDAPVLLTNLVDVHAQRSSAWWVSYST